MRRKIDGGGARLTRRDLRLRAHLLPLRFPARRGARVAARQLLHADRLRRQLPSQDLDSLHGRARWRLYDEEVGLVDRDPEFPREEKISQSKDPRTRVF